MKSFQLYRKDKTNYTFIIESALNEFQKVKLIVLNRDSNNKRIDMAEFYEDYRSFRAVVTLLEVAYYSKAEKIIFTHFGGTDGKRKLTYSLKRDPEKKKSIITFGFKDQLIQNTEGCQSYGGEMLFSINDTIDMIEFFNLKTTINNWELTFIQKLISDDSKSKTAKKENKSKTEHTDSVTMTLP